MRNKAKVRNCPACKGRHQTDKALRGPGKKACNCRICYEWRRSMFRKCSQVAGGVTVKERQRAIGIISTACGAAGDMADGLSFGRLKDIMKEILGTFAPVAQSSDKG